ncbi:hypothetical protein GGI21_004438, partial [Coemansia aciculifera]
TVVQNGFQITSSLFKNDVFRPSRVVRSVSEAAADGTEFDYILVCTKALPNRGDNSGLIAAAVTSQTTIVLIQNGIGIEDPFHARYPGVNVISAVAYIDVAQPEDGVIEHGGNCALVMGPVGEGQRAEKLAEVWENGGVSCSVLENVQAVRWLKLAWNASFNTVAVASGGNNTRIMVDDPECCRLIYNIMIEVYRLGEAATGAPLPVMRGIAGPKELLATAQAPGVVVMPSMLMDFLAKRPLEHEVILGNPIQIARELGVAVPHMETVYALLRMIEKQYLD